MEEAIKRTENIDLASQENAAQFTSTTFAWWRQDLPLEVSYRYWRDVHSVLVSRIPGLYLYRLLYLAPNRNVWSSLGVDCDLPTADQPHGIGQLIFLNDQGRQAFGNSPLLTQYVHKDENNFCDRNATFWSIAGNAHTYVDHTGEATPNGKSIAASFVVCFTQQGGINVEEFRQHLVRMVRLWSEQNSVLRLRLHLLEPYDESASTPGVSHDWPQAKQYQAWIELRLRDEASLPQLFSSEASSSKHGQLIKAIHTFPVSARYTLVYNGKPTDVGLRGLPAVQTIEQIGADNQKATDLLAALYGQVVHGPRG